MRNSIQKKRCRPTNTHTEREKYDTTVCIFVNGGLLAKSVVSSLCGAFVDYLPKQKKGELLERKRDEGKRLAPSKKCHVACDSRAKVWLQRGFVIRHNNNRIIDVSIPVLRDFFVCDLMAMVYRYLNNI